MKSSLRWVFRSLALTIVSGSVVLADGALESDAGKILKLTEDTYRGLQSYRFEGTTVSATKVGGSVSKSETSFVVAYQKPNKFRVEYIYPTAGNWIRVSDGKTTWRRRSLTKESTEVAATDEDLGILDGSPVSPYWNIFEHVSKPSMAGSEAIDVGGKSHDCFVIQVEPTNVSVRPGMQAAPGKLWIDKSNHLILREMNRSIAQGGKGGENTQTVSFTQAEVNQTVPDDLFHVGATPKR